MSDQEFSNDHDILITLVAEVRQARNEIKEIKDNSAARLNSVEENKADKTDLDKLRLTLYGVNGDAGIIKTLADYKEEVKSLKRIWYFIIPILGFLAYLLINHVAGKQ